VKRRETTATMKHYDEKHIRRLELISARGISLPSLQQYEKRAYAFQMTTNFSVLAPPLISLKREI
jgi:hypothetical protein